MDVYGRHGPVARLIFLMTALLVWFARGFRRPGGVVVLCYHNVRPPQRHGFARQMRMVRHRVVPLPSLGEPLPPGAICVTFDDAFDDLRVTAVPAAQALGIPFAVFSVTGSAGSPATWRMRPGHADRSAATLSPAALTRLAASETCTIGSHSLTHARLDQLSTPALDRELSESRSMIMRWTGRPCDDIAIPYAACDARVVAAALRTGYRRVLTLDAHVVQPGDAPGRIGRFTVSPDMWPLEFMLTANGAYDWLDSLRSLIGAARRRSNVFPHGPRHPRHPRPT